MIFVAFFVQVIAFLTPLTSGDARPCCLSI